MEINQNDADMEPIMWSQIDTKSKNMKKQKHANNSTKNWCPQNKHRRNQQKRPVRRGKSIFGRAGGWTWLNSGQDFNVSLTHPAPQHKAGCAGSNKSSKSKPWASKVDFLWILWGFEGMFHFCDFLVWQVCQTSQISSTLADNLILGAIFERGRRERKRRGPSPNVLFEPDQCSSK